MKLTKGGLYQVIVFMKLTRQFKYPEDIDVAEAVAKKLRFKSSDTDIKDNQNEIILDTDDLEQDDDNFNTFERFQSM